MHEHVELGQHNLPIYPQTPNRIIRRLGKVVDKVRGAVSPEGVDPAALIASLGDDLYYVIETFVPNIRDNYPIHEFMGYPSRAAFETKDYDEDADAVSGSQKSLAPTFPQYLDAVDMIVAVNGGKRFLDTLGKALDLSAMRNQLTLSAMDAMDRVSTGSPSLPGTSGTSQPTTSGPTDPTSASPTEIGTEDQTV